MTVFKHPEFDNHEHLSFVCDPETGLKAVVAVHNTSRGPALANLDLGGGKSVIIGGIARAAC
jgi:glutamate dehydrogenase/leucine dehydrogenase